MACMHDPRSGQEGHVDANRVVKRRPSKAEPSGWGATGAGPRTSKIVSWSPWTKRPLVARSSMSAGSGRWCEGMWSHSEAGTG